MKEKTVGFKKRNELSREEKIELLKLIASGDIDKDSIDSETTFAGKDEALLFLMVRAQCIREGAEMPNIILLTKKVDTDFVDRIRAERALKHDNEK